MATSNENINDVKKEEKKVRTEEGAIGSGFFFVHERSLTFENMTRERKKEKKRRRRMCI